MWQGESGAEGALDHGHISTAQAAYPGAGKESIHVIRIPAEAQVCLAYGLVGKGKDLIAFGGVLFRGVVAGKEAVIGIEGCIEQILAV